MRDYCSKRCKATADAVSRFTVCVDALHLPDNAAGRKAHKALRGRAMDAIGRGLYGRRSFAPADVAPDDYQPAALPKAEKQPRATVCDVCSEPLPEHTGRGRPRRYCCTACQQAESALRRLHKCLHAQTFTDDEAGHAEWATYRAGLVTIANTSLNGEWLFRARPTTTGEE